MTTHRHCLWGPGEPRSTQSRRGELCRPVMGGAGGEGGVMSPADQGQAAEVGGISSWEENVQSETEWPC